MASEKWASLMSTYMPQGHQTTMAVMCSLFCAAATDNTNINNNLNWIKVTWDCLNVSSRKHIHLSDLVHLKRGEVFKSV
jgi:hypothetical protein